MLNLLFLNTDRKELTMENTYIISYDINQSESAASQKSPGKVYEDLYAEIKSYGTWAHITDSCWAVVSADSATAVRDKLQTCMRHCDRLMVVQSAHVAAWKNVMCNSEWLQNNL